MLCYDKSISPLTKVCQRIFICFLQQFFQNVLLLFHLYAIIAVYIDEFAVSERFFMNENQKDDIYYMRRALELARKAYDMGEVPVGAVAVWEGEIVGEGMNLRETGKNALLHAEIGAIDSACKKLGGWRLHKCTLYVTLEPCPMCAGAIINSRVRRVVFGAREERAGAFGSITDINSLPLNHRAEVTSGVLEQECKALMQDFFADLREKRKKSSSDQ